MPSSVQTVPVVVLFDYLLTAGNVPIANKTISVVLNYRGATSITPLTTISSLAVTATTDANGYWQASVVPNTNINPANTLYTVVTPLNSYDVTVGAAGPYQSTAVGTIVNTSPTLAAATSSVIGPLTVLGNLIATGTAAITGALTALSGTFTTSVIAATATFSTSLAATLARFAGQPWADITHPSFAGGADPTGATDSTAAIAAAITAAANGWLFIPSGIFSITSAAAQILLFTHPIHVTGVGYNSVLQVKSTTGATVDVIRVAPATATQADTSMYLFQDFRITAQSGTPGRHAFRLDTSLASSYLRHLLISRIWTDQLGGNAVDVVNTGPGGNGIFTAKIEDCYFTGGVNLLNIGDSVSLLDSTITGTGQIVVSTVSAAGQATIEHCNITCSGGVLFSQAIGLRFHNNNCQISVTFTGANSAFVNLNAGGPNAEVTSNLIAVLAGAGTIDCLRINTIDHCVVDANYFGTVVGANGIRVTAAASNTYLGPGNSFTGAGTTITNASTSTIQWTTTGLVLPGSITLISAASTLNLTGTGTSQIVGGTTGLQLANNANNAVNLGFTDLGIATFRNHVLQVGGPAPSFGTLQTGISIQTFTRANDSAGIISLLTTGAAPGAAAKLCDVTFGTAFINTPVVVATSQTTSGAALDVFEVFGVTTAGFSLYARSALANATTYVAGFIVIGT